MTIQKIINIPHSGYAGKINPVEEIGKIGDSSSQSDLEQAQYCLNNEASEEEKVSKKRSFGHKLDITI